MPAQTLQEWLREQAKFAPPRKYTRVTRNGSLVNTFEGVNSGDICKAIVNDAAGNTGSLSYRICCLDSSQGELANYTHKVRGGAPKDDDDSPSPLKIQAAAYNFAEERNRAVDSMMGVLFSEFREELKQLRLTNKELSDECARLRGGAIDAGIGSLIDKVGGSIEQLPALLAQIWGVGESKKNLLPSPDAKTDALKRAVDEIDDDGWMKAANIFFAAFGLTPPNKDTCLKLGACIELEQARIWVKELTHSQPDVMREVALSLPESTRKKLGECL